MRSETSSAVEWAGEDWGSLTSKHSRKSKVFDEGHGLIHTWNNVENERIVAALRASSDTSGKVKIKISKRDLEVLLRGLKNKQQQNKKEPGNLSVEQVLVRLINANDSENHVFDENHGHHKQWRPVLQSIPEVN